MERNPADIDMQLIAQWKATGKVSHRDLIRVLVTIHDYYEQYPPPGSEVPIQLELLEIIGDFIVGPVDWATAPNRERRRSVKQSRLELQAEADGIWASKPELRKRDVARLIAKRHGGNADTIRRAITKK
jgi:hypothetical protein